LRRGKLDDQNTIPQWVCALRCRNGPIQRLSVSMRGVRSSWHGDKIGRAQNVDKAHDKFSVRSAIAAAWCGVGGALGGAIGTADEKAVRGSDVDVGQVLLYKLNVSSIRLLSTRVRWHPLKDLLQTRETGRRRDGHLL
jgi:hypothetical protein